MYKIIENKKNYFIFSGILILLSLISLVTWGLKPGIDFTGGSLLEVSYEQRPALDKIEEVFTNLELANTKIQPSGD